MGNLTDSPAWKRLEAVFGWQRGYGDCCDADPHCPCFEVYADLQLARAGLRLDRHRPAGRPRLRLIQGGSDVE